MSRSQTRVLCLAAVISAGLLAACEVAPENVTAPAENGIAPMKGFSWVIESQVAGMPRPGAKRPLDQDLQFLRDQGVDVLVTLTEAALDPEALSRHGIESLHIPVADFHAPTQAQLDEYVKAVKGFTCEGRQVGTHCAAGLGRTGTFLAALFVARGMDADAALAEIRRLRPGSVEPEAQEQAVREFADRQE